MVNVRRYSISVWFSFGSFSAISFSFYGNRRFTLFVRIVATTGYLIPAAFQALTFCCMTHFCPLTGERIIVIRGKVMPLTNVVWFIHSIFHPFGSYLPPIPFIMVDSSFLFVWFVHHSGHIVIPITHTAITTSGQNAMMILTSMTRRLSPVSSFCLWFIFGIPIENAQLLPDVFCFVCRFYGFW